jgi:hypothetical protein
MRALAGPSTHLTQESHSLAWVVPTESPSVQTRPLDTVNSVQVDRKHEFSRQVNLNHPPPPPVSWRTCVAACQHHCLVFHVPRAQLNTDGHSTQLPVIVLPAWTQGPARGGAGRVGRSGQGAAKLSCRAVGRTQPHTPTALAHVA